MSITQEIVNQSIFTAALFLIFISVPKLLMITGWYTYRIACYKYGAKLMGVLSFNRLIQQEQIRTSLSERMRDPVKMVEQMLKEFGKFTKDIRDPLIESLVALSLMLYAFPVFPQITWWLSVAVILIILIIAYAFTLLLVMLKAVNSLKVQNSSIDYEI